MLSVSLSVCLSLSVYTYIPHIDKASVFSPVFLVVIEAEKLNRSSQIIKLNDETGLKSHYLIINFSIFPLKKVFKKNKKE